MGYRHQVISDTMAPKKEQLPAWFLGKYKGLINFDNGFWCSFTELKRYGLFSELESDTQKVVVELDLVNIRLVFFADESELDHPDIAHVNITKDKIVEIRADGWSVNHSRG